MDEGNRQTYKPSNRRNHSNSSSNSDQTHNHSSKPKSWNQNSSRDTDTRKARNFGTVNDGEEDSFPSIVGTCLLMCPVSERERRERLRDLSVFERLHGNSAKTSPSLAVKKFCRTINHKDLQASDVRPVPILEDTLNYLFNLLNSSDHPFEVVHDFIFDRTRSIRQDLSMQNAVSDQVIHMYERMVKFHIISYHHLRISSEATYSASMTHLNQEQLMKTLSTLFSLYGSNRASKSVCQDEPEFVSLYLLLHLGSHYQEPLSLWFRRIPSPILKSREVSFARRILRYYRLGNYVQLIRTTESEASFLQYCIVEPHLNEARVSALSCISYGGYKLQPYPLEHLSKVLMMKEYDIESLCIDCALELSNDGTGKGLSSTKQCSIRKTPGGTRKYYPLFSERIERLCAESLKL